MKSIVECGSILNVSYSEGEEKNIMIGVESLFNDNILKMLPKRNFPNTEMNFSGAPRS